jgi:ATP-dependent Clp protease ATP-binding subunit ClpB
MDLKLTTKAQEALSAAVRASAAAGHPHTEPAHLLKALTEQSDTTTPALLQAAGSSLAAAAQAAQQALAVCRPPPVPASRRRACRGRR